MERALTNGPTVKNTKVSINKVSSMEQDNTISTMEPFTKASGRKACSMVKVLSNRATMKL